MSVQNDFGQVTAQGLSRRVVVCVALVAVLAGAGTAAVAAGPVDTGTTASAEIQEENETELVAFTAVSQGGYISFSSDTEDEAVEAGTPFPTAADGEEPIEIEATVEDGEWEATNVSFPPLPVTEDLDAEVEATELSGQIDPETGEMTVEGNFEVTIADGTFSYVSMQTTGESNGLTGEADFSSEPATVTLVDNGFTVEEETENSVINRILDLPADEEGENWLVLKLDINLNQEQIESQDQNDDSTGDGSEQETDDEDGEDTTTLALTVLGQAVAFVGLGSSVIVIIISLIARFTGLISLDS